MKVLCEFDDCVPIAYYDVFEEGDCWEKIQGCEVCPWEDRQKCCGSCAMLTVEGCAMHWRKQKPFKCVISPHPNVHHGWCHLEWKCTKGSMKGKIKKACEPRNVFH